MAKSLVIVESPAKAKTINRYLGNDFIVKSSIGHIRDLSSAAKQTSSADARKKEAAKTRDMTPQKQAAYKKQKNRRQLIARMGIDPDKDWAATYEILPGKEKVVAELKKLARNADTIYLATDLDREGEAIAWHLREAIGGDDQRYRRVIFNEITKKAIQEAFEDPGDINMDRVSAQQARRFLDRVVGFMVSPLLWSKIARGLSAGRVQSVAVKLIVEREREIRAFNPEEYWELYALLSKASAAAGDQSAEAVKFQVVKQGGKNFRPNNKAQIEATLAQIQEADFIVSAQEEKPTQTKPSAPYITSTLQQAASTRFGFGVKRTMRLAQRLYEAGYITYMRTDSTNLSAEAIADCRQLISTQYGEQYLPEKPRLYSSKANAQEAHEAIRPSDVALSQTQDNMEADARRLYELIWRQFVACQMPNAAYISTKVLVKASDLELQVRGRVLQFDGYTRVQPTTSRKEDEQQLPQYSPGMKLHLEELLPSQHFTKPPPRYAEASLVRELEKRGIGRPSTYSSIITTIQERGYVSLQSKRFYAEKIGEVVTERLNESFTDLLDYNFTAQLEAELDQVSNGKVEWKMLLNRFYQDFVKKLDKASSAEGMRTNMPSTIEVECPECGRAMQVRTASTGVFLGCSGYALSPKERCKTTINLIPGNEVVSVDTDDDEAEARILRNKRRCEKCDSAMDTYLIDTERKLHLCGNNPDCDNSTIEAGKFKIKGYDGPSIACDKCAAEMQLKTGRFGKYFGCMGKDCKNTRNLLRSGEPAPPKADPVPMPELSCQQVDDTYVLRDGAAGIFLAASQFPKHRETRSPYVDELLPHQNEIDPKYQFLLHAPVKDSKGNRSLVRFARKTRAHYVMTEREAGKPSGWRADYVNGHWVESGAPGDASSGAATKQTTKQTTKKTIKRKAKKTTKKTTKKTIKKQAKPRKAAL